MTPKPKDVWGFISDINYIKQLEGQESLTSQQMLEVVKKEQQYIYLAKRLKNLMSKLVKE